MSIVLSFNIFSVYTMFSFSIHSPIYLFHSNSPESAQKKLFIIIFIKMYRFFVYLYRNDNNNTNATQIITYESSIRRKYLVQFAFSSNFICFYYIYESISYIIIILPLSIDWLPLLLLLLLLLLLFLLMPFYDSLITSQAHSNISYLFYVLFLAHNMVFQKPT